MSERHSAYIGIGSNLGDPTAQVRRAIEGLASLGTVSRRSSLYKTQPWGNANQPHFINAVVLLETELSPRRLLNALKAIESKLGRTPTSRWGPRLIDLDILTYDNESIEEEGLIIPHEHLQERAFVLVPLAEIEAAYTALRERLAPSERSTVERLER